MVAKDPQAWRWFGPMLVNHTSMLLRIVDDLMFRNSGKRCNANLLRPNGVREMYDSKAPHEPIAVMQEELAQMANLSRNTLGSILRDLEKRDLIELSYGNLRMLDSTSLNAMLWEND